MRRIAGIHFIDEIPVTSIDKLKRYLLREYVLSGAETAAAAEEKMKEEPAPAEDSPGSLPKCRQGDSESGRGGEGSIPDREEYF